jgi:hypothetical protein
MTRGRACRLREARSSSPRFDGFAVLPGGGRWENGVKGLCKRQRRGLTSKDQSSSAERLKWNPGPEAGRPSASGRRFLAFGNSDQIRVSRARGTPPGWPPPQTTRVRREWDDNREWTRTETKFRLAAARPRIGGARHGSPTARRSPRLHPRLVSPANPVPFASIRVHSRLPFSFYPSCCA